MKCDGLYDGGILEDDVEDEGEFFDVASAEEEVADVDERVAADIGEPFSINLFELGSNLYSVTFVRDYKAISSLMVEEFGGKVCNSDLKLLGGLYFFVVNCMIMLCMSRMLLKLSKKNMQSTKLSMRRTKKIVVVIILTVLRKLLMDMKKL